MYPYRAHIKYNIIGYPNTYVGIWLYYNTLIRVSNINIIITIRDLN